MGVVETEETSSLSGESVGGAHRVLECTQAHPLGISTSAAWKGTILLWEMGEVTESGARAKQAALFPL